MSYLCDIVVLTWNNLDITKTFIDSLLASSNIPCRLIIIDNASSDGTREYLASLKDIGNFKFSIVLNNENRGFVAGMNQGLKLSEAEYICLANNDLIFSKGWLEEIIVVFKSNERIGIVNPNSNNLGLKPPKGMALEDFTHSLHSNSGDFAEMPFCIGFCMVIKKDLIDKVGLLSEEYAPAFFEDSDYSLRAQREGYLIGVAKSSYVLHKEHASFDFVDKRIKEDMFAKSREVFINKWGRMLRMAWIVPDKRELTGRLKTITDFARRGNFIKVFTGEKVTDRKELFYDIGAYEHSGVDIVNFSNALSLL
jgi:O-antigen biosynthesis protein